MVIIIFTFIIIIITEIQSNHDYHDTHWFFTKAVILKAKLFFSLNFQVQKQCWNIQGQIIFYSEYASSKTNYNYLFKYSSSKTNYNFFKYLTLIITAHKHTYILSSSLVLDCLFLWLGYLLKPIQFTWKILIYLKHKCSRWFTGKIGWWVFFSGHNKHSYPNIPWTFQRSHKKFQVQTQDLLLHFIEPISSFNKTTYLRKPR